MIETIAGSIFMVNYGSRDTKDIICMWAAIAIVIVIIAFNLIKYGFKNGALASLAELVFSISAAFLIVCVLIASSQKGNQKRKKYEAYYYECIIKSSHITTHIVCYVGAFWLMDVYYYLSNSGLNA